MKKFVKGLLFGSIVGGTVALLTTKHNGKKNREKLYENIVSLSEDISTLSDEAIPKNTSYTIVKYQNGKFEITDFSNTSHLEEK